MWQVLSLVDTLTFTCDPRPQWLCNTHHFDSCNTVAEDRETGFSRHAFSQPLTLYCTGLVPWKWLITNIWGTVPRFSSAPPRATNHPAAMSLVDDNKSVWTRWLTLPDGNVASQVSLGSKNAPNVSNDLGHQLTDFHVVFSILKRNYPANIRQFSFFAYVNPFCCHVAFCEARCEAKLTFLNIPPTPKKLRNQKLLLQPVFHLPTSFGEDWLSGLGYITKKTKNKNWHKSSALRGQSTKNSTCMKTDKFFTTKLVNPTILYIKQKRMTMHAIIYTDPVWVV